MKKRHFVVLFVLVAVLVSCIPVFGNINIANAAPDIGAYDLVLSPDGDDSADGTLEAPMRTLEGAKVRLKSLKESFPSEPVTVYLRGGRYEFSDTVYFTEEDVSNVRFVAYDSEEVVFSGARAISGFNEETVNGLRVFTKELKEGDPTEFKSLFNDKGSLPVPRYPESGYFIVDRLDPDNDLWTEENTEWELTLGQRSFFADPADLKTDFTDYDNVQVRILHYWHDELMYLTDFNRETGRIGLSRPSSMKIRTIDRYYFENVFEAMNEPGEWYLNKTLKKLFYVPQAGERADTLVLYASKLERLVDIENVDGLTFEGIRFTQTDWNVPSPENADWDGEWRIEYDVDALQAAYDVVGVVTTRYASGLRFVGCEFKDLGADGIKMLHGTQNSTVERCLFRNIAATAVFAGAINCQPDEPECVKNITVKNCDISGYGRKFYCAIGVHITFCEGAEIAHNEISDGYYTGISVGWEWGYEYHLTKNIKITDNLIYNIGQGWLSDMGGIYMLGMQPGTVISGNVIHNVAADPGEGGYGGWGIYLDEGSSRMLVEKNLVFCCGSQSYNIHYGEGNIIRNNIGAFSAEGQVSVGTKSSEQHATAYYYDNIFVSKNGAPIYIYMSNTSHFYENGNLMWDVTKKDRVVFATDSGKNTIGLFEAKLKGFIHNPTVSDPLFTDAEGYDFTLREDSPAFSLNFQPWDYNNAGTIEGTTIGFSLAGGQTAYNAGTKEPAAVKFGFNFYRVLRLMPILFVLLALLFWIVITVLSEHKKKCVIALAALLSAVILGIVTAIFFVHWNAAVYVICGILIGALISLFPVLGMYEQREKKAVTIRGLIWLAIHCAVFFGLTFLLNNVLVLGESLSICVTLLTMVVLSVFHLVRLAFRFFPEGMPKKRSKRADK